MDPTATMPHIKTGNSSESKIEQYDIGQLLGKGGFASVYRARDRVSGEDVAIKVIQKSLIKSSNSSARVVNEIKIHAQLHHPKIVRLRDYFEDKENVYMVLALCAGGNLYRYLKINGPLNEEAAATLVEQILRTLQYLHGIGVVHRDLKLSNILLDHKQEGGIDSLQVQLCDFGLAVQLDHPDEEHYTLCGTPNYIAPEVAGQKAHSFPADIWSVGCLFYSMVTGLAPFDQGNVQGTLQKIKSGDFEIPTHLSKMAVHFMQSLLNKNPLSRPTVNVARTHPFILASTRARTPFTGQVSNFGHEARSQVRKATCSPPDEASIPQQPKYFANNEVRQADAPDRIQATPTFVVEEPKKVEETPHFGSMAASPFTTPVSSRASTIGMDAQDSGSVFKLSRAVSPTISRSESCSRRSPNGKIYDREKALNHKSTCASKSAAGRAIHPKAPLSSSSSLPSRSPAREHLGKNPYAREDRRIDDNASHRCYQAENRLPNQETGMHTRLYDIEYTSGSPPRSLSRGGPRKVQSHKEYLHKCTNENPLENTIKEEGLQGFSISEQRDKLGSSVAREKRYSDAYAQRPRHVQARESVGTESCSWYDNVRRLRNSQLQHPREGVAGVQYRQPGSTAVGFNALQPNESEGALESWAHVAKGIGSFTYLNNKEELLIVDNSGSVLVVGKAKDKSGKVSRVRFRIAVRPIGASTEGGNPLGVTGSGISRGSRFAELFEVGVMDAGMHAEVKKLVEERHCHAAAALHSGATCSSGASGSAEMKADTPGVPLYASAPRMSTGESVRQSLVLDDGEHRRIKSEFLGQERVSQCHASKGLRDVDSTISMHTAHMKYAPVCVGKSSDFSMDATLDAFGRRAGNGEIGELPGFSRLEHVDQNAMSSTYRSSLQSHRGWVQSYPLSMKAIPKGLHSMYFRVLRTLHAIRSRIPQLIMYLDTSSRDNLRLNGEKKQSSVCKCMLMSNKPLPDFCVQWVDGTKLTYSLRTANLCVEYYSQCDNANVDSPGSPDHLSTTKDSRKRWEGHLSGFSVCESLNTADWKRDGAGLPPTEIREKVSVAQHAMRLCIEKEAQSKIDSSCYVGKMGKASGCVNARQQGPLIVWTTL
jgi:serine/threonine protein kinase